MNIMSCTFTVTPKDGKFDAYCEEAKQVIAGSAAIGFGKTPLEAMEDAYKRLMAGIAEEKELEVQTALDELLTEAEADSLTPGGFDGIGEFSDELETTIKELIAMVRKGLTEREQQKIADCIREATTEYTFSPGQKLMMDWTELLKNFTPYDAGVSKEAWDTWHTRLKAETSQFLANPPEWPNNDFIPQIQSLQTLIRNWLTENDKSRQAKFDKRGRV